MASKFKVSNKKTIIAIAAIIILLIIAVTGTVVFLRDRGSTEAAEYTTTDTNEQVASDNQEQVQNEEQQAQANDQAANQEDTETQNSNEETTTANPETTTGTTENNEGTTTGATGTTGATTGTGTTSGTTTTTDTIQESTITRTETEEVMVAENFLVGWQPLSLNVDEASSRINAEETDLEVVKTAKTETGENLVFAGDDITYTISVTNKSQRDLNNIEISDTVPALTTLKSIDDEGVETQGKIKWEKDIKAGETVEVSFTVTVNEGATGTVRNVAIANGEESQEEQTAIITSEKTSEITRKGQVVSEPAMIGDEITYTISITNTGDKEGTTTVKDSNLEGILADEKAEMVGNVTIFKGEEVVSTDKTAQDLISGIENIVVPANGSAKVVFTIKVNKVDGKITNVALIGDETEEPTNPEETDTFDVTIKKEVKDIIRAGEVASEPVKAGDIINYNIILKNIGSAEGEVNVSDVLDNTKASLQLKDSDGNIVEKLTLLAGEEKVLTTSYTVEQSLIDAQEDIKNVATVTYDDEEKTSEVTTPVEDDNPVIDVVKTATKINGIDIKEGDKVKAGDKITYTITVKNTGNVTLENIVVTDDLEVSYDENNDGVGDTTVAPNGTIKTITSLAPDGEDTIQVIYTVEQTDVDNYDRIKNVATATVPNGPSDNGEDENVPTDKTATIDVVKTATKINGNNIKEGDKVKAGDKITYTITVKNTGYTTLKNIVVTDDLKVSYDENKDGIGDTEVAPNGTIKTIEELAPNGEDTIEVIYTVEQTDVDNYDKIKNVATATVPDGPSDEDDDETIPTDKTATIDVVKTATKINGNNIKEGDKVKAGDKITYTITVKNTGYTTLKNIVVTDELEVSYDENKDGIGDTTVAPGATIKTIVSLIPDEEDTIEVIYTVTQTDVDTYETIRNVATATVPNGPSDEDDETTPTNNTPNIDVIKTAEEIKAVDSSEFVELNRDAQGNVTSYVENVGDVIRYTITATNNGAKVLENVNVIDQNHNVKVLKITKGTNVYEQTGKEDDITAGTNLLNFLPDVENRTLEPGESYVIEVEYTVENVNNVSAIENTAVATATPRNEQTPVSDNDDEDVPVAQKLGNSIIKTSVKINDQTLSSDEDRKNVKLHANDVVTYEITVSNDGNKDLTGVAVTDDHNVTVTKIEKVNADGTRTEDRELKRNATTTNLLGKTTLGAGETYIITVTYVVPDNYIDESDPVNGDKLINIATITTNETGSKSEDDTLVKDKKANITQSKTSKVVGNDEDDHIINSGDIIEYTITVNNDGNITGTTTVKDSKLRENIQNDKVFMMNGETTLSKDDSLTTECINVTSSLGTTTTISVNKLADGYTLGVSSGETITMTFRVEVGKLLPGETVINTLDEQENTYTENEVEASITVNKELVKPQNTVIVIDLSLSMAQSVNYSGSGDPMADTYEETRWYALTEALDKFLDNYMDGNNKVTIIGYNERVKAEHILITDTASKTDAMNSYRNVFTREQYNFVPEQYKGDVDNLIEYKDNHDKNSGTLLASGTNIEAGMIKVQEILHGKEQGAQVILMTDGVANRAMRDNGTIINDDDFSDTYEGIDRASSRATTLKNSGTTMYTISLSLGKSNETYTTKLENMASEDENGKKLSTSANGITEIINYFKKISEIISEYHGTLTTKDGILVLTNTAFNVDSRYVQNVIITIPNDETDETFTLTWPQFSKYYDPVAKTIDIKQFAIDKNIQGITGDITIDINVDPTINTNAD